MSGRNSERVAVVTASARSLPARTYPIDEAIGSNRTWTRSPSRSACASIVNAMTRSRTAQKKFGSKRTDVTVLHDRFYPLAIIEVKIGVKTLSDIAKDLLKVTDTIGALKPQCASRVRGAVVFQVHIAGSEWRYKVEHFAAAITTTENKLKTDLAEHGHKNSSYDFSFHPLQSENEGSTARDIEPDGDEYAWGEHGHATRYYAVLIKSKTPQPKAPRTIAELKVFTQS
jgi:hypothetical protein